MKYVLILLLLFLAFYVATNYILGAIRRFLGIPPQKKGFGRSFFAPGNKRDTGNKNNGKVLYQKDDVVVLSGEQHNKHRPGSKGKVQDAHFSDLD